MDMKEMVGKVKKGEPLYGSSQVSSYLQGVAARNSRFSELFIHVIPWFNIVNHDQVRVCSDPRWSFTVLSTTFQTCCDFVIGLFNLRQSRMAY